LSSGANRRPLGCYGLGDVRLRHYGDTPESTGLGRRNTR
jgi:hypothetical protein